MWSVVRGALWTVENLSSASVLYMPTSAKRNRITSATVTPARFDSARNASSVASLRAIVVRTTGPPSALRPRFFVIVRPPRPKTKREARTSRRIHPAARALPFHNPKFSLTQNRIPHAATNVQTCQSINLSQFCNKCLTFFNLITQFISLMALHKYHFVGSRQSAIGAPSWAQCRSR